VATRFRWIATGVLAVVATSAARVEAAMNDMEPLSIHVLIQDETKIPPATLAAARTIATRIFRDVGVRIEWLDSDSALSVKALGEADRSAFWKALYTVHVVTRVTAAAPGNALGFASPGTRVSTVVYQRVEQMSRDAGTDPAVVLGHAMAHELGHLLLRRASHSAAGLMQASLDVQRSAQGRVSFTAEEAQSIRIGLANNR